MISFKGVRFEKDIILTCVRWSVAYPLSTRKLEEMVGERGVCVNHSTLNRWVIKYRPQLEEAFHRRRRSVVVSWSTLWPPNHPTNGGLLHPHSEFATKPAHFINQEVMSRE